jgi:hypothetical protein
MAAQNHQVRKFSTANCCHSVEDRRQALQDSYATTMHTDIRWAARAKKPANFPESPNLKQMQIDHNTTPIPESCDIGFEARLEAAAHDVVVEIASHSSAEARSA